MDADKQLHRGARVSVRSSDGRMVEDVVWEDLGDVVLVCGQDQYTRLASGYPAPMPIGFRREDVRAVPA